MSTERYFEDFSSGEIITLGPRIVEAGEIVEFASEFDPQPFHLDEEAGRKSLLGGLAASGWHTAALTMRMIYDAFLAQTASMGSPGITSVSWRRPVLAGDTLSGVAEVLETRRSSSRPQMGVVTFRITLANQKGETVMIQENPIFIGSREVPA
ncbi:MaoC family dehydratase [Breoghania corrubedonensis]|nr:MaoC family dehydratase [Breoghania corrubedonensis]